MTTPYLGDPFQTEREAWLAAFDRSYSWWYPTSHRVFMWRPGDLFVRVYHEHDQGKVEDKWLLQEGQPLTWETAAATITERVNAGYASGV